MQALSARVASKRRFLPLSATALLFAVAYVLGAVAFPAMRDGQAFFNLLVTTPFLLISVVGETFVIISGGIDLSVSGVIALTTVASASLLQSGWNPWLVMALMLLMGISIGGIMGFFITYLKVQPFIATLAGMWFARGLSYVISDSEIRIYNPVYRLLTGTRILIPGLADPVTKKGDYITILVVVALVVLAAGMYIAQFTRFGRTVYAMGGNNGANEQSARLMGLPVDRTKVTVYMLNGFCSALAGIAYSIYVGSGHGGHAMGFELTVIAAVVIGGTALTGGEGYVLGALFGVLITALIQSLIQFNGQLSSWWTSIVIGGLMLVFIGVQSLLATLNTRRLTRPGSAGQQGVRTIVAGRRRPRWRDRRVAIGAGAVVAVVLGARGLGLRPGGQSWRPAAAPRRRGLPAQGVPPGPGGEPGQGRRRGRLRAQRRDRLRRRAVRDLSRWADHRRQRRPEGREAVIVAGGHDPAFGHRSPGLVHARHVFDVAHAVRPVLHVLHERDPQGPAQDRRGSRRRDGRPGPLLARVGEADGDPAQVRGGPVMDARTAR